MKIANLDPDYSASLAGGTSVTSSAAASTAVADHVAETSGAHTAPAIEIIDTAGYYGGAVDPGDLALLHPEVYGWVDLETALAQLGAQVIADDAYLGDLCLLLPEPDPSAVSGGGGSAITVKDEGTNLTTALTSLDFVGAGVTATNSGGDVTVTISGSGGALTVEEVDGSPTDSAVSKLVFPNGTLSITSHVATYTPAGGITQSYAGYNVAGASWDVPAVNHKVYAKAVTLANDCLITSIGAYIQSAAGTSKGPAVALYDDSSGSPGKVIAYASAFDPMLNLSGGARWVDVALGVWVVAGTYWLVVRHTALGASVVCQIAYDGSGSDKTAVGADNDWRDWTNFASITTTTNKFSIRANTIR